MRDLATAWIAERIVDLQARLTTIRWPSSTVPLIAAGSVSRPALALLESGAQAVAGRLLASTHRLGRSVQSAPTQRLAQHDRAIIALQLRADALFKTIDLYTDAIASRSDTRAALLLAGTDRLLEDALARPIPGYRAPIAVTYLDSGGRGGAINRARTQLPGGIVLPLALVRVSPESLPARLSSCLHEAGHQLSADLDLLQEGSEVIEAAAFRALDDREAARVWAAWHSELLADCWNIGLSGGAPGVDGLQRLLSLPAGWLLRVMPGDPHPPGYLRNRFVLALVRLWHPHAVLDALERRVSASASPPRSAGSPEARKVLALDAATGAVALALSRHRFAGLGHQSIAQACEIGALSPRAATRLADRLSPRALVAQRPLLGLAALSYARLLGRLEVRRFHHRVAAWLIALAENRHAREVRRALASPVRCRCEVSTEVHSHV